MVLVTVSSDYAKAGAITVTVKSAGLKETEIIIKSK